MAFDGITLNLVVKELNNVLVGGKLNKIYEPDKNEIILGFYSGGNNYALDIVIMSDCYRMNLTTNSKPNPYQALNFCMFLRKYLLNAKLSRIYTNDLERIAFLEFECFNEMNDKVKRTLIVELMGKHSNIILVNEDFVILDSLRHLDSSSGSSRDIMPAHKYVFLSQDKYNLLSFDNKDGLTKFIDIFKEDNKKPLTEAICNKIIGISKPYVLTFLKQNNSDDILDKNNITLFYNLTMDILKNEKHADIKEIENGYSIIYSENNLKDSLSINFFLDDFYKKQEQISQIKNYRASLLKVIQSTLDKITKKLVNINKKIQDCDKKDLYQKYGELLIANLYRFDKFPKEDFIELEDYYKNGELIKIPLDSSLSLSQNAKRYFKKQEKLKNTLDVVSIQKKEAKKEIEYLESLLYELDSSKNLEDFDSIYSEIADNILFTDKLAKKQSKKKMQNFSDVSIENILKFTIDGFTVYVGKNNRQNDYLTLKVAKENDLWFHTKQIHGSHVILKNDGTIPKQSTLNIVASLAAYYSRAKFSSNVPVDYTLKKYVKKPAGSKPGMVIYTNQKTLYVEPSSGLELS